MSKRKQMFTGLAYQNDNIQRERATALIFVLYFTPCGRISFRRRCGRTACVCPWAEQ